MFFSVSMKRKSTNDVRLRHILQFGMLDTYKLVKPFNSLQSQNVAHNCDHATFTVGCCYDIFQHLLRICMSTETSVIFQAIHQHTISTCRNILLTFVNSQTKNILSVDLIRILCRGMKERDNPTIRVFYQLLTY